MGGGRQTDIEGGQTDRQTEREGGGGGAADRRVQQELPLIYLRGTKIKRTLHLTGKRPTKQTAGVVERAVHEFRRLQ